MSEEQITLLMNLLDAGIEAEVARICTAPTSPLSFESLVTDEDKKFAHTLGVAL